MGQALNEPAKPEVQLPGNLTAETLLPWNYENDYLAPLIPLAKARNQEATANLAAQHFRPAESSTTSTPSVRQSALHYLVVLRSSPMLRPVARAIPKQWQTRVKNWLLKP